MRMKEQYHKRRDFIVRRFNENGFGLPLSPGFILCFSQCEGLGIKTKWISVTDYCVSRKSP